VFENRVLRRIFGPKRDEVTGELRKLHNEDHHERNPQHFLHNMKKKKKRVLLIVYFMLLYVVKESIILLWGST
jgi:hypothetical protein